MQNSCHATEQHSTAPHLPPKNERKKKGQNDTCTTIARMHTIALRTTYCSAPATTMHLACHSTAPQTTQNGTGWHGTKQQTAGSTATTPTLQEQYAQHSALHTAARLPPQCTLCAAAADDTPRHSTAQQIATPGFFSREKNNCTMSMSEQHAQHGTP